MGYKHLTFEEDALFLVTGAAGFIGSNLCEAILKLGYKVRALDDLSTGKQTNIDLFKSNQNYEFIQGDIKDYETCNKVCKKVTYVLNQAAWGSVPRSIERPLFYCANNIQGTLNMMEAARQNNVKKFVYASSSSVYGDEPNLPKQEGREGNLLSPYALTKHVDEEYGKLYTKLYGLDTYGMRYFNVFGKRQDPNGAYAA
ncbi:MAG: SDR family NAD(P)-dependent oxidoreductase, partial [Eubacterium sp.]